MTFREFLEGMYLTSHRDMDTKSRLNFGWDKEDRIFTSLAKFFGADKIRRPQGNVGSKLDKSDKIDGFITFPTGKELAVQIKSRESGSDILVEVYKDFEHKVPGRDMITKAQVYIVLDPSGTSIYIIPIEKIKAVVNQLCKQWQPNKNMIETPMGTLRLQRGDMPGSQKLIAYLNPQQFSGMVEGFPGKIKLAAAA